MLVSHLEVLFDVGGLLIGNGSTKIGEHGICSLVLLPTGFLGVFLTKPLIPPNFAAIPTKLLSECSAEFDSKPRPALKHGDKH